MKKVILLAVAAFAIFALPAAGGKYAPTLVATPDVVQEGAYFNLSGCGYDERPIRLATQNVGVWVVEADAEGCFSFDFARASGVGEQNAYARQQSGKSLPKVVAQTTITVTP